MNEILNKKYPSHWIASSIFVIVPVADISAFKLSTSELKNRLSIGSRDDKDRA